MTLSSSLITVIASAFAGAAVGSFAAVVRSRGWHGALQGRSHCDGCQRVLHWYELVPLASYAAQGGRCRSCGTAIGRPALLAEIVGAAAGGIVALAVVLSIAR
jgi:leader peptidase (prepilin peptidase) / N-methyltransferase